MEGKKLSGAIADDLVRSGNALARALDRTSAAVDPETGGFSLEESDRESIANELYTAMGELSDTFERAEGEVDDSSDS